MRPMRQQVMVNRGWGDPRGLSPMMVLLLEVSPGHSTEGGTGEPLGIIKLRRWVWESSKANVVNLAHITKYKKKYLKKKIQHLFQTKVLRMSGRE